jgi:hypothetical protein
MNHSKRLPTKDPLYEGFEIVANKTKMLQAPKQADLSPGELRSVGTTKSLKEDAAAEEKKKAEERLALLLK